MLKDELDYGWLAAYFIGFETLLLLLLCDAMLCLVPPIFLVPLASFAAELLRFSPIIFDYFLDDDPLAKILLLFTPNPVVLIPDPLISEACIFAIADWFLG